MIPITFPSRVLANNTTTMQVVYLSSITGLQKWKDYIPVKHISTINPEINSFSNTGAIQISVIESSGKQAWLDYIPVYLDNSATIAWQVSDSGYIATDLSAIALSILTQYGENAHIYLPGIGTINGITSENWLDNLGTLPAIVNNGIGKVDDGLGSISLTQVTPNNEPTLRLNSGVYSWEFDGTDMLTFSSTPFEMSDNHFVVVASKNTNTTALRPIYAHRGATTPPAIQLYFNTTNNVPTMLWRDNTGTTVIKSGQASSATNVFSFRRLGNLFSFYQNGALVGTESSETLGATSITTSSIGGVTLTTNYLIGFIYPVIVIKGEVSSLSKSILEKFVGQLSGVSL